MAVVNVPVDEFRKNLVSIMEQRELIKFVWGSDIYTTDFHPDVLEALMEKISQQNHQVLQWMHSLDSVLAK